MSFELDYRGGEKILKEMAARHVRAIADKVASAAGEDAEVAEYTTDRAVAAVRVPAHQQAKDGALTRAAATAGLEVRSK